MELQPLVGSSRRQSRTGSRKVYTPKRTFSVISMFRHFFKCKYDLFLCKYDPLFVRPTLGPRCTVQGAKCTVHGAICLLFACSLCEQAPLCEHDRLFFCVGTTDASASTIFCCRLQSARCTVQDARSKVQSARCKVHGPRCTEQSARCKVHGPRCTVQGAQCKVHSARCTVQ